jgi:hypothetical protein
MVDAGETCRLRRLYGVRRKRKPSELLMQGVPDNSARRVGNVISGQRRW